MNYSTVANDLLFKTSSSPGWEAHPYAAGLGGAGDLHYYERPGNCLSFFRGKIPETYMRLNVRAILKEHYPKDYPNLDTVGYAVFKVLEQNGIKKFITAEDRGWELSDFWATLEAVYITREDYDRHILPKIGQLAQNILKTENKSSFNLKRASDQDKPLAKKKKLSNPKLDAHKKIQFFPVHDKIERACAVCENIKESLAGVFIKLQHAEKEHHERIESLAHKIFSAICQADSEGKKLATITFEKRQSYDCIDLVQWVFKQKLELDMRIESLNRSEDCILLIDSMEVSWS